MDYEYYVYYMTYVINGEYNYNYYGWYDDDYDYDYYYGWYDDPDDNYEIYWVDSHSWSWTAIDKDYFYDNGSNKKGLKKKGAKKTTTGSG